MTEPRHDRTPDTAGWHRPDVETAALEHLTTVVGPVSARQIVDGLLARGRDTAAKDTPRGASTLPSGVLDLLAAIRDALDVPTPDVGTPGGYDQMRHLTTRRAASVVLACRVAVQMGNPSWAVLTEGITGAIARQPVTYPVWQDGPDGGERP